MPGPGNVRKDKGRVGDPSVDRLDKAQQVTKCRCSECHSSMVLQIAQTKKHHRIGMRDDRLSVGARRGEPEVAETRLIERSRWRRVGHVILDT